MITSRTGLLVSTLGLLSLGLFGCSAAVTAPEERDLESHAEDADAILGGSPATAYPESVLVNMMNYGQITSACSGSLIAPNVVLTAGHCVHGFDGWQVVAPFAGFQKAQSSKGATYDWKDDSGYVNPDQHDVGLIILDSPIQIDEYPSVADKPVSFGSKVVNIGRIDNGYFSDSELFVSDPHEVWDGASDGFPYSYGADEVIQSGDSGGPVEIPGAKPHVIVAVNSGGGGGSEILARVDLVFDWIKLTVESGGSNVTPDDPNDGGDPNNPDNDPGGVPDDPGVCPGGDGICPDCPDGSCDPGAGPGGGDCGDIGYEGACTDDGSLLYCEDGELVGIDCPSYGSWCVTIPGVDWSDCL